MAFTTSGQETEWAYSYSPEAHTGLSIVEAPLMVLLLDVHRSVAHTWTPKTPWLTSDQYSQRYLSVSNSPHLGLLWSRLALAGGEVLRYSSG